MSIAVAVKKGQRVVVGADTQQNFGSNKPCPGNLRESKLRRIGPALLASTGWGLYDNILDDYLSRRKAVRLLSRADVFQFFKGFWRALHKEYSFVNDQSGEKDSPFGDLDASFMVVNKAHIFHVSSNMSVTEFLKFHAIGSGSDYALGAMHVLYEENLRAEEMARRAVDAAMVHNIYCGGEIEILKP